MTAYNYGDMLFPPETKRFFFAAVFLFAAGVLFGEIISGFEIKDRVLVKYHGMDRDIVIPDRLGIHSIGEKAFAGTQVRSVTIPVGVGIIESQAFAGCAFLTSISLPNTLTVIGSRAFFNCSFLENINIPRSLIIVGDRAFFNCRSVREITMPDTLKSIGRQAFAGCFGLAAFSVSRRTAIGARAFMGVSPDKISYRN